MVIWHVESTHYLEMTNHQNQKGWIRGNAKIGPVLEVVTNYHQGKHGVEIRIVSLAKDGSGISSGGKVTSRSCLFWWQVWRGRVCCSPTGHRTVVAQWSSSKNSELSLTFVARQLFSGLLTRRCR